MYVPPRLANMPRFEPKPTPSRDDNSLTISLDNNSRDICLTTWEKELFNEKSHYKLLDRASKNFNERQYPIFVALFAWRDYIARFVQPILLKGKSWCCLAENVSNQTSFASILTLPRVQDESPQWVLNDRTLFNITENMPLNSGHLLTCCQPIPPMIRLYANDVVELIQKAFENPKKQPDDIQQW
jgi:exosome complex exonuclease RRP6